MLVTNIFTPHRTQHSDPDPCQGCGEQLCQDYSQLLLCLLLGVKVRIVTRKAANCKLKESRLGWTRVFGPRPRSPHCWPIFRLRGQVRRVSCNTWSVQTWPESRDSTGPRAPITKCFVGFGNSIPARSLAGTSQRILAGVESLFLLTSNVSITEFCLIFSSFSPHPYQHCVMNRSKM